MTTPAYHEHMRAYRLARVELQKALEERLAAFEQEWGVTVKEVELVRVPDQARPFRVNLKGEM